MYIAPKVQFLFPWLFLQFKIIEDRKKDRLLLRGVPSWTLRNVWLRLKKRLVRERRCFVLFFLLRKDSTLLVLVT